MDLRFASEELKHRITGDRLLEESLARLVAGQVGAVFVRTRGGVDPFRDPITSENFSDFALDTTVVPGVVEDLQARGFEVLFIGTFALIVRAPLHTYAALLGIDFVINSMTSADIVRREDLFIEPAVDRPLVPFGVDSVERLVLQKPAMLHQNVEAPAVGQDQLDEARLRAELRVPSELPVALGGTVFGIVDSGFLLDHPLLASRGLQCAFAPMVAGATPDVDKSGHGTAMLGIASTIAPAARFLLASVMPNEYAAIEHVTATRPDVLSCSWGWRERDAPHFPHVRCAILNAIAQGTVVVIAAGNFGDASWPAGIPGVIAVGGVHANDGDLRPSDVTSSFISEVDAGRVVPDVCGLAGLEPRPYIQVPVPPGSHLDELSASSQNDPFDEDGTLPDDGWAFASCSSGATAQVAAVAALMRATNRALTVSQVKSILLDTAVPVAAGNPSPTGHGLVDAMAAMNRAAQMT